MYEHGRRRAELPVGVMRRRNLGLDRVFVNCAVCHSTTVREAPDKPRKVYVATGASHFDLGLLEKFFADIVVDERFTANVLVPAVEREVRRQARGCSTDISCIRSPSRSCASDF